MVPEACNASVGKAMDPAQVTHRHRIVNNNYIELRAPGAGKTTFTPPSPTTSGYSESGSEMDNHDSGRVSEMEGSPQIQLRNETRFGPGAEIAPSREPFVEGKATIKSNFGRSSSSDSATVTLGEQEFRTLVVCVHDARTRLNNMERKVDALAKAMQLQHDESKHVAVKLSRTLVALGNDFRTYKTTLEEQNGRRFRSKLRDSPHAAPLSFNNNNLSGFAKDPRDGQPPKSSPEPYYKSPGFPHRLHVAHHSSPVAVAPSPGVEIESYDNDTAAGDEERRKSERVNSDVIASSTPPNDGVVASMTYPRSPVYAVVNKKNSRARIASDQPPLLPRRSQELLSSLENDELQKGPSVEDLDEIIQESVARSNDDENLSASAGSLTCVSRFSDIESLMSVFENSTVFSEDRPIFEEDEFDFARPDVETYDNELLRGSDDVDSQKGREKLEEKDDVSRGRAATVKTQDGENTGNIGPSEQRSSSSSQNVGVAQSVDVGIAQEKASIAQSASSLSSGKSDRKEAKKGNALLLNYNKLFKRKGKKKRSESDASFTFVTSPFYEAELARTQDPKLRKHGNSVESIVSDNQPTVSSTSNISSGREDGVSSSRSRDDVTSPIEADKTGANRSLVSVQSPANTQLLRLQGGKGCPVDLELASDFGEAVDKSEADETYDNFDAEEQQERKEMQSETRNSPEFLRASKRVPADTQIDEPNPPVSNGHAFGQGHTDEKLSLYLDSEFQDKDSAVENEAISTEGGHFEEDIFTLSGGILDRLQREQADRIRFESGGQVAPDRPPPKPSRPDYQHANGGIPAYPRGPPVALPRKNIMTPEELTVHEAQEKLRIKEMEDAMLLQTLHQQQKQAAENAKWLEQEEHMLNPEASANSEDSALRRNRGSSSGGSYSPGARGNMEAPPPPSVAPSKPPRRASQPKDEPAGPPQAKLEEVKTAPTMQLNRDQDDVYKDTMEVVKAVLGMNNMTMDAKPEELFASVKTVGGALKHLCASLEKVLPDLPKDFHREVDMAQRTTNKDLSQVINQLKLVQRFFATTQVVEYKKCLMAANQVLAIDAKNLLDVVDRARIRKVQEAQEKAKQQTNDIRQGASSSSSAAGYEPEGVYPDGDFL